MSKVANFIQSLKMLSPAYVVKRAQAGYVEQLIRFGKERAQFKAAEKNRLNANWQTDGRSINSYLQQELTTMRNRSRWLLRNNANAVSGINAFISYCIGVGIIPISTVYDPEVAVVDGETFIDQKDNVIFNEGLDELWEAWAENADITGSETNPISFYDIEELVLRKWIEDGEAFVHVGVSKEMAVVPFYCELFEPESLDESKRKNPENGNPIIMGVELDKKTNREVAYWIKRTLGTNETNSNNPLGTSKEKSERFDAKSIFHVFKRLRPGQVRGIPFFHAVSEKFFQLDQYEEAELIGNKIAACMGIYIERAPGLTSSGDLLPGNNSSSAQLTDSDGNPITNMQPGIVGSYPKGSQLTVVSPQKPSATFGMFTEHIDRQIGAGMEGGLSYEALTRNTSNASYAGGRLAVQRDYQSFRQVIKFIVRRFTRPLRQKWTDVAVLADKISAPGYDSIDMREKHNRRYWSRHDWIPPAWQAGVNPKDDIGASRDAMRAGMSDLSIECGFLGRDYRTVLRMQKRIKDTTKRFGLILTSDGENSIVNGVDVTDDSDEDAAAASNNKEN